MEVAWRVVISSTVIVMCQCVEIPAQVAPDRQSVTASQSSSDPRLTREPELKSPGNAEVELQTGTALTHQGLFAEAIPHLLAARGGVSNEYAANFNLALCYVGVKKFDAAIRILTDLRNSGRENPDLENLLAQSYVGNEQPGDAMASLQKAAALSPRNEKIFVFVADACRERQNYQLGLQVVDAGLHDLPDSARLHYERGIFLSQLDESDRARSEFELASKLGIGGQIGYLAAAHEALSDGKIPEAIGFAREGVNKGYESHALLTILAEALIRSGISPGQPDFVEAEAALNKAVAEQPNDPVSQLALGSLHLSSGRLEDAIMHLEKARELEPGKLAVYANLAKAYRRHGEILRAQNALAMLQKLNQEAANRITSAPGDHKLGYAEHGSPEKTAPQP